MYLFSGVFLWPKKNEVFMPHVFFSPAIPYEHIFHDETIQGVFFAPSLAVDDHALFVVRIHFVRRTGFAVNREPLQNDSYQRLLNLTKIRVT